MSNEKIANIPNTLSFYRIAVFPLILYFLLTSNEKVFVIFLCINLVTDFLDGFIARTFNMITKIGAKLDSIGDIGTYILAFTGVFRFKAADLTHHAWMLYIFIFMYVLSQTLHIIRFGHLPSMHLYSFKITGYLQALLFFLWFFVGFFPAYYYFAIGFGILVETETMILIFLLKERRLNAKGLCWILKE